MITKKALLCSFLTLNISFVTLANGSQFGADEVRQCEQDRQKFQ